MIQVWEIRGADLTLSPVHAAAHTVEHSSKGEAGKGRGISLRFPRFIRRRPDKRMEEATTDLQVLDCFLNQAQYSGVHADTTGSSISGISDASETIL